MEKQDAGTNAPPAITKIVADPSTELVEPGPTTGVAFKMGEGTLTVKLLDTDLDETLHVRVFVDYQIPGNETPPRSTCAAGPTGTAERSVTCSLIALCLASDIGVVRDMTVVVFDRDVLDTMPPAFQWPGPDGLSASKYFHLKCTS